jgi:hypothetical protein
MIIQLDNNWFIEDDGNGYMLYKWSGKVVTQKSGTETKVYDWIKYPPTFARCIELYARLATIDSAETMKLQDYMKSINDKYTDICEILKIK